MFTRSAPGVRLVVSAVLACILGAPPNFRICLASPLQDSKPQAVPVFVNDFELAVAPSKPPSPTPASNVPKKPTSEPSGLYQDSDQPSEQARLIVDTFSKTLLQSLQNSKFTSSKQSGARPAAGVLIRGVFAEPDTMNRIRRGLLGNNAPGGKFLLYVGIFNLSRPDAPLYELAPVQSPDTRYGPLITLNNYIPLAKYEVAKNPSEEDVRKICAQIVANLTALLAANPTAFSQ
jgi:hypothetical protein